MIEGDAFEIVFVCTGNRFRSPLAEELFRQAAAGIPLRTASRGTLDLGPVPVLPEAAEEAARLGLDLSSHRARSLDGDDLTGADLVVGFERRHVARAVVEAGAARARTFTLPELVALLDEGKEPYDTEPVGRARAAIAAANAARQDPTTVAELVDPLGKPRAVFRDTAAELQDLVGRLAGGLFGPR